MNLRDFSSVILPSLNLPTRIFGPCRSHVMATVRPTLRPISLNSSARFRWSSAVPCEKLRRTTSTPARNMRSRIAGSLEEGPSVATILVLRSIRRAKEKRVSGADVQHHFAARAAPAVLPQVYPLPGAQRKPAAAHGNRHRRRGERGLDVPRHVVGAFRVVLVERISL